MIEKTSSTKINNISSREFNFVIKVEFDGEEKEITGEKIKSHLVELAKYGKSSKEIVKILKSEGLEKDTIEKRKKIIKILFPED